MGGSSSVPPIVSNLYSFLPPIMHMLNTQQSVDTFITLMGEQMPEVVRLRDDIIFDAEDRGHMLEVIQLVHDLMTAPPQPDAVFNNILDFVGSLQLSVRTLVQQFDALEEFILAYQVYLNALGRYFEQPALRQLHKKRRQLQSKLGLNPY